MSQEPGRSIAAAVLIGVGAVFLVAQFVDFSMIDLLWPFFVIVPGVGFIIAATSGSKDSVGLIFPGAIVTGTGLILLFQNITDAWESWAYIWTLYPGMVGLAMTYAGRRLDDPEQQRTGRRMMAGSVLAFVVFAAFFELLIFDNIVTDVGRILIPLVLIGAGVFMLLKRQGGKDKRKPPETA